MFHVLADCRNLLAEIGVDALHDPDVRLSVCCCLVGFCFARVCRSGQGAGVLL